MRRGERALILEMCLFQLSFSMFLLAPSHFTLFRCKSGSSLGQLPAGVRWHADHNGFHQDITHVLPVTKCGYGGTRRAQAGYLAEGVKGSATAHLHKPRRFIVRCYQDARTQQDTQVSEGLKIVEIKRKVEKKGTSFRVILM